MCLQHTGRGGVPFLLCCCCSCCCCFGGLRGGGGGCLWFLLLLFWWGGWEWGSTSLPLIFGQVSRHATNLSSLWLLVQSADIIIHYIYICSNNQTPCGGVALMRQDKEGPAAGHPAPGQFHVWPSTLPWQDKQDVND